ncbi:hypothetical protein DEV91_13435 [Phyllobacterium brassicacearum]|nr:hypothetical protein DEV91_13435 [Phyllobacterium brassicacearum]
MPRGFRYRLSSAAPTSDYAGLRTSQHHRAQGIPRLQGRIYSAITESRPHEGHAHLHTPNANIGYGQRSPGSSATRKRLDDTTLMAAVIPRQGTATQQDLPRNRALDMRRRSCTGVALQSGSGVDGLLTLRKGVFSARKGRSEIRQGSNAAGEVGTRCHGAPLTSPSRRKNWCAVRHSPLKRLAWGKGPLCRSSNRIAITGCSAASSASCVSAPSCF